MNSIRYWNRANNREEVEQVYGDAGVRFFYENPWGQRLANGFFSGALFSRIYGLYQNSLLSRRKIPGFVQSFGIDLSEFESRDYTSFNDFFVRKYKPGARSFVQDPRVMPAFAEARYLAFERVSSEQVFPVKGADLSSELLVGRADVARSFEGGPLLIARLCPLDYHRFHYPDSGRTWDSYRIHGKLHSVNPVALKARSSIFFTNERQVTVLDTENFGRLAYIEVGAMAVGKIVQTHLKPEFERGDEKGYFLFGGSTVIVLGQPGAWKPAQDLLDRTAHQQETLVRLGDGVAACYTRR